MGTVITQVSNPMVQIQILQSGQRYQVSSLQASLLVLEQNLQEAAQVVTDYVD